MFTSKFMCNSVRGIGVDLLFFFFLLRSVTFLVVLRPQFILTYIFIEMYNTSLHYGPYVYPRWGKALGVCMATVSCLQILIWAVVAISKETGTLKEVSVSSSPRASLSPLCGWTTWHVLFLSSFFTSFFSIAAFQKINPTPELLEGQQQRQERRADGAGASGSPVHRHSHRHGF